MSLLVLYACCAGLDVHKKTVVVCLIRTMASGQVNKEVRTCETTTAGLVALADWLASQEVTHVALESTGVYWRPVFNLLEGRFQVILVNAQHMKAVPGHKTDVKDSEWIADLLQHGLLSASFIPPSPSAIYATWCVRVRRSCRSVLRPSCACRRCWRPPTSNWLRWP